MSTLQRIVKHAGVKADVESMVEPYAFVRGTSSQVTGSRLRFAYSLQAFGLDEAEVESAVGRFDGDEEEVARELARDAGLATMILADP